MWVRRAAIRPVPLYARVPPGVLGEIETDLADEDDIARDRLDSAFARFEATQPAIADRVAKALGKPIDETALALGYFLTLAVWLAFERNFEGRLGEVLGDELGGVEQSLSLDEELRRVDPAEAVDSDDVVAMEQPDLLSFVHEHLDNALEAHAGDVDVDDVHAIYRVVLIEVLALSYAVRPPEHYRLPKSEFLA
ncbi:MAG TPA: hypothetical protein VJT73_04505 [Polyangiaceae bacterium]|nr:hypothetical protein [Polyangiaceae bacterium]